VSCVSDFDAFSCSMKSDRKFPVLLKVAFFSGSVASSETRKMRQPSSQQLGAQHYASFAKDLGTPEQTTDLQCQIAG
jgi:hypothetical protein